MLEYSSPSGIGPSAGGGDALAPLNALLALLQDADADTGGDEDEDASCGVSLAHMVPSEPPSITHERPANGRAEASK